MLIAAGNVTLLLLSRAVARQREIAVRLAIGCSRARLVHMLLTESVLLAALGVPLSLWLAWQAPGLMRRMFPMMPQYPLEPDVAVLSYLTAASLTAGLVAGLAPAVESLRQRLAPTLAGHDALAHGAGRSRLRDVLIAAQMGMSLVLLAGTALFLRAERSIALRDPSVDAEHVMVASYEPPRGATAAFMPAIAGRMEELPGVRSVAYAGSSGGEGPFGDAPEMVVRGREAASARTVPLSGVSASYFATLKRPMFQGLGFAGAGQRAAIRPLVISDALARVWWPGTSAIGAEIDARDGRRFDVVGVVHADAVFTAGTADAIQAFTLALAPPPPGALFLRFDGDPSALKDAVRDVLREMSPSAPNVPTTLAEADAVSASKFMPLVEMVGTLGLTAIVLALVGVYGVVSFAVGRRTREIGVRMALGATRADIARLVLVSGAPPIGIGIVVGLLLLVPGVIALMRIFRYAPVPLHPVDPATYALVVVVLSAVAFLTMLVPARRASAVPPSEALRTE
jgi:predicted permease